MFNFDAAFIFLAFFFVFFSVDVCVRAVSVGLLGSCDGIALDGVFNVRHVNRINQSISFDWLGLSQFYSQNVNVNVNLGTSSYRLTFSFSFSEKKKTQSTGFTPHSISCETKKKIEQSESLTTKCCESLVFGEEKRKKNV